MKLRQHYQYGQFSDPRWEGTFKSLMEELGLYYLAVEKAKGDTTRSKDAHGLPLEDPVHIPRDGVAKFHLSNGGEIANIHFNPRNRTTPSDEEGSLGLMVNYRYDIDKLKERKQMFADGIVVMDPALEARLEGRLEALNPVQAAPLDQNSGKQRDGRLPPNWLAQILNPGNPESLMAARGR